MLIKFHHVETFFAEHGPIDQLILDHAIAHPEKHLIRAVSGVPNNMDTGLRGIILFEDRGDGRCELKYMAVHSAYRRHGWGGKLLQTLQTPFFVPHSVFKDLSVSNQKFLTERTVIIDPSA